MAKNKVQAKKKKERERRVAKEKLAAAAKKKAQEKSDDQPRKSVPEKTKFMTAAVPKVNQTVAGKKSSFTQRRSGGG